MKLNPEWISHLIMGTFASLVGLGAVVVIILVETTLFAKILFGAFLSLVSIAGLLGVFYTFKEGKAYYKKFYIPTENFTEINQFSNCIVFGFKDTGWAFTKDVEKLGKLRFIRSIEYYTRKKEFLGWTIAPLVDLDKELKEQELLKTEVFTEEMTKDERISLN